MSDEAVLETSLGHLSLSLLLYLSLHSQFYILSNKRRIATGSKMSPSNNPGDIFFKSEGFADIQNLLH